MKKTMFALVLLFMVFHCFAQTDSRGKTKKLLQGAWFGVEYDEHAVFDIEGDSITYIDDFNKFKYLISKDTFDLKTTQFHYKELILKLTPDSLIFKEVPSGE